VVAAKTAPVTFHWDAAGAVFAPQPLSNDAAARTMKLEEPPVSPAAHFLEVHPDGLG
jgi:hypothetical protein